MTETADLTGNGLRGTLRRFVERDNVQHAILGLIVFNAIMLGIATAPSMVERYGSILEVLDTLILGVFVIELLIKLYVYRLAFFKNAWNLLDFFVVGISFFPGAGNLSVLRALRIIRALRLFGAVPQMRAVIKALADALPGMGAVIAMLLIIFYIFGVMTTNLYAGTHPQWFGTLGGSLYSLFQIMTLESWSHGIVRFVMEDHPYAWALFVPFIIITAFAVLNLFIGLIVNSMQSAVEAEHEETAEAMRAELHDENAELLSEVRSLAEEVRALRQELRR